MELFLPYFERRPCSSRGVDSALHKVFDDMTEKLRLMEQHLLEVVDGRCVDLEGRCGDLEVCCHEVIYDDEPIFDEDAIYDEEPIFDEVASDSAACIHEIEHAAGASAERFAALSESIAADIATTTSVASDSVPDAPLNLVADGAANRKLFEEMSPLQDAYLLQQEVPDEGPVPVELFTTYSIVEYALKPIFDKAPSINPVLAASASSAIGDEHVFDEETVFDEEPVFDDDPSELVVPHHDIFYLFSSEQSTGLVVFKDISHHGMFKVEHEALNHGKQLVMGLPWMKMMRYSSSTLEASRDCCSDWCRLYPPWPPPAVEKRLRQGMTKVLGAWCPLYPPWPIPAVKKRLRLGVTKVLGCTLKLMKCKYFERNTIDTPKQFILAMVSVNFCTWVLLCCHSNGARSYESKGSWFCASGVDQFMPPWPPPECKLVELHISVHHLQGWSLSMFMVMCSCWEILQDHATCRPMPWTYFIMGVMGSVTWCFSWSLKHHGLLQVTKKFSYVSAKQIEFLEFILVPSLRSVAILMGVHKVFNSDVQWSPTLKQPWPLLLTPVKFRSKFVGVTLEKIILATCASKMGSTLILGSIWCNCLLQEFCGLIHAVQSSWLFLIIQQKYYGNCGLLFLERNHQLEIIEGHMDCQVSISVISQCKSVAAGLTAMKLMCGISLAVDVVVTMGNADRTVMRIIAAVQWRYGSIGRHVLWDLGGVMLTFKDLTAWAWGPYHESEWSIAEWLYLKSMVVPRVIVAIPMLAVAFYLAWHDHIVDSFVQIIVGSLLGSSWIGCVVFERFAISRRVLQI